MAVKSTWMDTARNNAKAQDERDKQASIIRQQNIKNQQSAQIASRLDTAPMAKNTQSAQIASRLDNKISSPILNYAIGSWQGAFAADRLNNGSYAATGGIKQEEAAQKAKDLRVNTRSAQLAANLDNSLMGQATRDNQKASFERAMESLYNQMEIAKNANNTQDYTRAQDRYSNISKMLQDLENPTSTVAYAADWENRMRTEIMSTDDRVLMPKLERLLELADARMREASDRGDERRNGLTETEKQYNEIYNSLKNQYGDQVDGWIEYAKRMDNKAKMKERLEQTRQEAKDKKFGSSAKSVPLNMLSGAGYMDIVAQKMQRGITGSNAPIDYNSDAQSASKMVNTIRSTVSEDMGATGQFLYNVGMSIADLIPSIVAGKISPSSAAAIGKATMTLLGGAAATNAMQQAVERGASDDQALTIGLLSGAMEAVMEKMPLDRLLNPTNTKAVKEIILNTLKQAGVEGMEEGLTTIANTLADALVMGNRSELQTNIRAITAAKLEENPNMSREAAEEAATKEAMREWLINLGMDTAAGVASGVAFGSITSFADYINYKNSEAATPRLQPETQKQPPVADITPTPQQAQEVPTPASVMPKLQQTETIPAAEFRQTAAEILSEGIFDSPTYGEALEQTGMKRADVRDALRAVARNNIAASNNPNVQTVLSAIKGVDVQPVQAQTTPGQKVSDVVSRITGESKAAAETTPQTEPAEQPAMSAVGDMGAKTSDFRHEVKKSQTHGIDAVEDMLGVPEDQRKEYVHDVVTEQESLYNANLRLEQDYEGEKNYLRNTLQWTGEDVDAAHQILEDLEREAAAAGTEEAWDNYHEWRDVVQKHESSLGGGLQAIAKYARRTGSKIVQRASEAIMDARDGTDRAETMNTVADYAKQYDKAVGKKDVDSLLQIIRDTSVTRRTGSLRHNELSKTMNWALDRIAEYAKAELANPKKVEVTESTPVVPQANYTVKAGDKVTVSDRNNVGTVTSVNDDGTYTVHFKSRQGSEATKTFSGDMVTKLGHKTTVVSNTATIHEVGRFYSFLENFAASGIEAIATDKQKTSFGKAVLTIRRNAMLSKAATIMRNLVGNNVFDPLDSVANNMSVPLDMLLSTITGTRSVAVDKSWFSEAKRKGSLDALAMAMLEVGLDVNAGGAESKYETKGTRTFHMANGPFSKLMSQWEKYMGYAMNATDEFQKGGIAAETQRGIDRLYEQGKIKDDTLRNAGEKEAQYRTFQDESIPAQMTQGLRQVGNILHAGDIGVGDVLIPFAQVPANLPARVADYSPVGLARGIGKMAKVLYDAKKGNLTAAQQASAVKDIGRGITGSSMIAAAAALAAKGIIRVVNPGGEDENKDKAASEKAQGLNGTQWNLSATIRAENGESAEWQDGDTIMSIAFLDPINGMLTTGALLAEDYKEARKNGDKLSVEDILADSLSGTIQSFLELPAMQTMRDVYNAYQYSDGERPIEKFGDMATAFGSSVATSFIPNALKGIAQGIDPYQRDLYAKDDLLGQTIDQMIGSVPGMRNRLTAKQDVYGNDVKNPDQPLNFLNANILPGAITTYTETDLQKALNDLSEQTGKSSMYLSKDAPKSITVDDEKIELTAEQKKRFMSDRGDVYAEASSALENDETYQGFSKEWKLKAYEYAETYANEKAKGGLNADYEPETWVSDLEGASQDEIAEAMVQKVVSSTAKKHKGGEYAGLGDMLDNGTIDDDLAIALLPPETHEKYMKYGKGVPAADLMDVLAYKNSDDVKVSDKKPQELVKAYLNDKYKGSANRKIKIGIWCTLYAESTCPW